MDKLKENQELTDIQVDQEDVQTLVLDDYPYDLPLDFNEHPSIRDEQSTRGDGANIRPVEGSAGEGE